MIEVNIKAEDYHVAEALGKAESLINNNNAIDVIYDDIADQVHYEGEHFDVTFKRAKAEEKKEEEKKEMTALEKLSQMSCKEFTLFMRSIGVFGDNDFVTEYGDNIGELIIDANQNSYAVNLDIEVMHDYYLYVKYVDCYYCRECTIVGLSEEQEEWDSYFKLEKIAKDYEKEILAF